MHPARRRLVWMQLVGGPLVLASYAYCILRFPEASAMMWGGVPDSLRPLYTAWMFVAAAGYFAYGYLFLVRVDPDEVRVLGRGYGWIALSYALVLFPSAIWMPATKWLLDDPSALRFWLMRIDLFAVAAGSIGLLIAAVKLEPRPSGWVRGVAIAGAIGFAIQTVVLDALIWPALFPVRG
ncbi:hypothetical protein ACNOYE_08315 [Nannocystaceae bacterium ST9]